MGGSAVQPLAAEHQKLITKNHQLNKNRIEGKDPGKGGGNVIK